MSPRVFRASPQSEALVEAVKIMEVVKPQKSMLKRLIENWTKPNQKHHCTENQERQYLKFAMIEIYGYELKNRGKRLFKRWFRYQEARMSRKVA